MGTSESSSPGHAAAGTASMLAIRIFSGKPSSLTLTDTAVVAAIRADGVVGRCRDTTDLYEVNL
jgi:hypothetical protein